MGRPATISPSKDPLTVEGRLNIALDMRGVKGPTALGRLLEMDRQTAHRWIQGANQLSPVNLFLCADALNVSARWLATGVGAVTREEALTPDESGVLAIFRNLPLKAREKWIRDGNELVELLSDRSAANPFPRR